MNVRILKDRIEDNLENIFIERMNFTPKNLYDAMFSSVLGGKMIRGIFLYLVGQSSAKELYEFDMASCAIEIIHAYSLVHDDLPSMDNDVMRRGKPSCHVKYGENVAILAGDALQSLAFEILSNNEKCEPIGKNEFNSSRALLQNKLVNELAKFIGMNEMCAGQCLDVSLT